MNQNVFLRRCVRPLRNATLLAALVLSGGGCGSMGPATQPRIAWALKDRATMSVVVRRADLAELTAEQVSRLLGETPLSDDSPWLSKVGPTRDVALRDLDELQNHPLYANGPRIVASEIWVKELAQVAPKPSGPHGVVSATNVRSVKTSAPKYTSILQAIDSELSLEWAKVMERRKAIGDAQGEIDQLSSVNDDPETSDNIRRINKLRIGDIKKELSELERESTSRVRQFIISARVAARKVPQEQKDSFGPVLVNLKQAIIDAGVANDAAAVRYPKAITTLADAAQQMAALYISDIVEERTGKRPNAKALNPSVIINDDKVEVSLNGLAPSDLGRLKAPEVAKEATARLTSWAKRARNVLGVVTATKAVLDLQERVLTAVLEGFESGGWKAPTPSMVSEVTSVGPR